MKRSLLAAGLLLTAIAPATPQKPSPEDDARSGKYVRAMVAAFNANYSKKAEGFQTRANGAKGVDDYAKWKVEWVLELRKEYVRTSKAVAKLDPLAPPRFKKWQARLKEIYRVAAADMAKEAPAKGDPMKRLDFYDRIESRRAKSVIALSQDFIPLVAPLSVEITMEHFYRPLPQKSKR